MANLLADLPSTLPQEQFDTLLQQPGVRIERILSQGQVTAEEQWYCQPQHEWVLLLQGAARLEYADGEEQALMPGDYINIPAKCRHRVSWTDPKQLTLWLAVFYD